MQTSMLLLLFIRQVVSDSLQPHELQHARPPCPSPTPRVYPNSCPLSQWCHLTISSPAVPFSCSQSFPASGSFPISQLLELGGQSIGASASSSVFWMNIQGWFPLGLTGLISFGILSPCLCNLYAEYIMRNARLDESQAGIKTAGKNISINHLR